MDELRCLLSGRHRVESGPIADTAKLS